MSVNSGDLKKLDLFKKKVFKKLDQHFKDDSNYWYEQLIEDVEDLIKERMEDNLGDFIYEVENDLQDLVDGISNKRNEKKLNAFQENFNEELILLISGKMNSIILK